MEPKPKAAEASQTVCALCGIAPRLDSGDLCDHCNRGGLLEDRVCKFEKCARPFVAHIRGGQPRLYCKPKCKERHDSRVGYLRRRTRRFTTALGPARKPGPKVAPGKIPAKCASCINGRPNDASDTGFECRRLPGGTIACRPFGPAHFFMKRG